MSEHDLSNVFGEMPEANGLDLSAIFGNDAGTTDTNPFAAAADANAATEQTATDGNEAVNAPAAEPTEPGTSPLTFPADTDDSTAQEEPASSNPSTTESEVKPKAAAKEQEPVQQSLFDKPAVFSYGSAKDPILDGSMTFEELRIAKAEDFPELAEGKRVSWNVEYGKVHKAIADPKGKTIETVKEEIERSKEFLTGLKKAKDKNPDCLVKPRVTAQSKGTAAYKGVFRTLDDARASDKTICLLPSAEGQIFELRKTEMGEFIAPKNNVVEFQRIRAGFSPALPLIPYQLLQQIISFFRHYMNEKSEFEALAHIYWDREQRTYVAHIPPQSVTKARIQADTSHPLPEDRYLHYADIHSHNSMAARFSVVDDEDEKATRIYAVVGRLDQFFPEITVRMSCGGTFVELDPGAVFEGINQPHPVEWQENVKVDDTRKSLPREDFLDHLMSLAEEVGAGDEVL